MQTDEGYDDNGNRTGDYVTGRHNRLLGDGTYRYQYDAEGNRTARFIDADSSGTLNTDDTDVTEYAWDHRNRLVGVTEYATYGGLPTQVIEYTYDAQDRRIRKTVDTGADGTIDEFRYNVHLSRIAETAFDRH